MDSTSKKPSTLIISCSDSIIIYKKIYIFYKLCGVLRTEYIVINCLRSGVIKVMWNFSEFQGILSVFKRSRELSLINNGLGSHVLGVQLTAAQHWAAVSCMHSSSLDNHPLHLPWIETVSLSFIHHFFFHQWQLSDIELWTSWGYWSIDHGDIQLRLHLVSIMTDLSKRNWHHIMIPPASIPHVWATFSMADINSLQNSVMVRAQLFGLLGTLTSLSLWLCYILTCADFNFTRWLWSDDKYVAVKVDADADHTHLNAAYAEFGILDRISTANPRHQGWHFIRHPLDSFILENGPETHLCLVYTPLREPLWLYQDRFRNDVLPSHMLKIIIQMVLHGLNCLHLEYRVIHTGVFPSKALNGPSMKETLLTTK